MIFLSFPMSFFALIVKQDIVQISIRPCFGRISFFFGLIILFGLFDSDFWEFFKFFLQIRMILIPLRVVFIILVPFHLENSFLGKTFYFLENLFCLAFAILLIVAIIMPFLERISKIFF
ncbi:hypothetical protein cco112_06503 [Campylobacter coli 2685]|nr:hypothetical protein cco112_06503 [Campylobacter coli 2685]